MPADLYSVEDQSRLCYEESPGIWRVPSASVPDLWRTFNANTGFCGNNLADPCPGYAMSKAYEHECRHGQAVRARIASDEAAKPKRRKKAPSAADFLKSRVAESLEQPEAVSPRVRRLAAEAWEESPGTWRVPDAGLIYRFERGACNCHSAACAYRDRAIIADCKCRDVECRHAQAIALRIEMDAEEAKLPCGPCTEPGWFERAWLPEFRKPNICAAHRQVIDQYQRALDRVTPEEYSGGRTNSLKAEYGAKVREIAEAARKFSEVAA